MKLSAKDIILITLVLALGGPGTAQALLSIAGRYIESKLAKYFHTDFNEQTFLTAFSRLRRDGLVEKSKIGFWRLTAKGRKAAKIIESRMSYEEFKSKWRKPDTIIIFDVPEYARKKRDYLRIELSAMGFRPLQKSVWIGGSPLPIKFMEYLKETRSLNYIHIFTIRKFGTLE